MKKTRSFIKTIALFIFVFMLSGWLKLFPCTVAVVSGKATADGRPLLWKNRDTTVIDNKILHLSGPKYSFIGLVNARDVKGEHVWAGINTEGFAIMNSQSSDLAEDERASGDNGRFMKTALGECANAGDFENLLQRTNGARETSANFGVIDAEGNACFFEASKSSFVKFDANDPRITPAGYIVRTNYAFTSSVKYGGGGYIRFERASRLFQSAAAEGRLSVEFILQEAARDLANEKLHSYSLAAALPADKSMPLYVNTNDTINRNSTVSVALFHGVTSKEKAHLATMWVVLGQPVCSVAVPLWAHVPEVPAPVTGPETAPLNDFAKALVSFLYPDRRGHMPQYLNVTRLRTYGGEGVLSKILGIEKQILRRAALKIEEWEGKKPTQKEMRDFETEVASWALESLKSAFPDI